MAAFGKARSPGGLDERHDEGRLEFIGSVDGGFGPAQGPGCLGEKIIVVFAKYPGNEILDGSFGQGTLIHGPEDSEVLDGSNLLDGVDPKLTLLFEPIGRTAIGIEVDSKDVLKSDEK